MDKIAETTAFFVCLDKTLITENAMHPSAKKQMKTNPNPTAQESVMTVSFVAGSNRLLKHPVIVLMKIRAEIDHLLIFIDPAAYDTGAHVII